jgi:hypothetical protein
MPSSKPPIALTLVILAASWLWTARERTLVTTLREKHLSLTRRAAALGASAAGRDYPAHPRRPGARHRDDGGRKAAEIADAMVAFAMELDALRNSGREMDIATRKRLFDLLDSLLSLNTAELRTIIADLRSRPDMDATIRGNLIDFSISMLARRHPQAALEWFTESADLLASRGTSRFFRRWAGCQLCSENDSNLLTAPM